MKITLLSKDCLENMLWNTVEAALTCTGNEERLTKTDKKALLLKLIRLGHESVLEHINFTFRIEDISRAVLQELARHRHISMSVQSTRNTMKKILSSATQPQFERFLLGVKYILNGAAQSLPDEATDASMNNHNIELIQSALTHVAASLRSLAKLDQEAAVYVPDFVKYLLPECAPTSLIMTVNMRELRHIFKLRSSPAALLEFRYLVKAMYESIPVFYRHFFDDVVHESLVFLSGPDEGDNTKEADSTDPDQPKA